jgi:hypothetical protein
VARETLLPISVSTAIIALVCGAVLWLNDEIRKFRLKDLEFELRSLRAEIDRGGPDQWTRTDMELWVERLRAGNPTLSIPMIRSLRASQGLGDYYGTLPLSEVRPATDPDRNTP